MSRRLRHAVIGVVALAASTAAADPAPAPAALDTVAAQEIGAELGVASGGGFTPGGLRLGGRFLYQLSDVDWFDGAAMFTYGGGGAQCYRDRTGQLTCSHDLADGQGIELSGGVRRFFPGQGAFLPFVRLAAGLRLVRFPADALSGVAIPLHGAAGIRARVAPSVAVVVSADLEVGLGVFGRGLGLEPQLGFAVQAGAEFALK
jgi:hypothetical protein